MISSSSFDFSLVYAQLTSFANLSNFWSLFNTAFGSSYDSAKAATLRSQWQSGNFSQSPKIEIVSSNVLGSANGAYSASTNKIYLSDRFVATAGRVSLEAVLLEEFGHFVDAQVNRSDSAGDEGAIFSALVLGESLDANTLRALKAEDDHATITVNGQVIQVELQTFTGTNESDNLIGTSGNDTFIPLLGGDIIIGGAGDDLLILDYSNTGGGVLNSSYFGFDILMDANAFDINGKRFTPVVTGMVLRFNLFSYFNDHFSFVLVQDSNFRPIAASRPENIERFQVTGTIFDDFIEAGLGNDTIMGGLGNDYIQGSRVRWGLGGFDNNVIDGGGGNDSLVGGTSNDTIDGGAGNDIINDYGGNDIINGDDGNDLISSDYGNDIINGGAGNDIINGGTDDDKIDGGDGDDTISGGAGNDNINGGAGNGNIDGGAGNDTILGGDGNDTILGGDGNDILNGGAGNNNIDGGAGNDTIFGGDGKDTISGGDGNDFILGGDGNDKIDGGAGNNNIDGGAGNDTIFGDVGDDTINGGAGNDSLIGGAGNDSLIGGDGDDTFLGSQGDDKVNGGSGSNTADYSLLKQAITLKPFFDVVEVEKAGNLGKDSLVKIQKIIASNGLNDTIDASTTVAPSTGITANLGTGTLTVNGSGSLFPLKFNVSNFENVIGTNFNDGITGDNGNNQLVGNAGKDTLTGGAGNDILNGGAGNDILNGGDGNDTLIGGDGADKFVFTNPKEGIDIIQDFSQGDLIQIPKARFGAKDSSQFNYNVSSGNLSFLGNVFAKLQNAPNFTVDFDIQLLK